MDVTKAVKKLDDNAGSASVGKCATYVRWALAAGGVDVSGHPAYAKSYGPFLVSKGFVLQPATTAQSPQKGDVIVLQPPDEDGAGHVAMFNGTQWVSDFRQRDFWAGPSFRDKVTYAVYRAPAQAANAAAPAKPAAPTK